MKAPIKKPPAPPAIKPLPKPKNAPSTTGASPIRGPLKIAAEGEPSTKPGNLMDAPFPKMHTPQHH